MLRLYNTGWPDEGSTTPAQALTQACAHFHSVKGGAGAAAWITPSLSSFIHTKKPGNMLTKDQVKQNRPEAKGRGTPCGKVPWLMFSRQLVLLGQKEPPL